MENRTGSEAFHNQATPSQPAVTTPPTHSVRRYEELDSLRGLAALSVLLYHLYASRPVESLQLGRYGRAILTVINDSPLRIAMQGMTAVILFFVLSGFVLSLPYYAGRAPSYGDFMIKRFCRIYLPYIVAILIALLLRTSLYRGEVESLGPDFATSWGIPLTARSLFDHLLLISNAKDERLDPVTWTLTHEMRISIFFPVIMVFVTRWNGWVTLAAALLISRFGVLIDRIVYRDVPFGDVFNSSYAIFMFVTGALLAKYRSPICARFSALRPSARWLIAGGGFALYSVAFLFPEKLFQVHVRSYLSTLGAVSLIVTSLSSPIVSRLLTLRPLVYLGRISFSLYLYHMIIFNSLIQLFGRVWPPSLILGTTLVVSLLVAEVAYRSVERPSMTLGRYLTRRKPKSEAVLGVPELA